jgi:hypothetical protein
MRPSKFAVVAVSLIGFIFIAGIRAKAQGVYGYTEIDYDDSTNIVTAYSETDTDYDIEADYKGRVVLDVYDQNSNLVYINIATDNNQTGYVSVTGQFTAVSDSTYTAVGRHELVLQYHYTDPDTGLLIWDDDWDFEQFTDWGVYTPDWYAFLSPAYGPYTYSQQEMEVGDTYDEASVTIPYAHPVNFRQTSESASGGVLYFTYDWDSSTGDKADLSDCQVTEYVTYPTNASTYVWPSPPFNNSTPNPTILPNPAAPGTGSLSDSHSYPGGFVTPYAVRSFTAQQYYRYKCGTHDWVKMSSLIQITRSVTQNSDLTWKYVISKSGYSTWVNPLP